MNAITSLNTDDYLDLYLFAKKIGDSIWQNEIIVKLRDALSGRPVDLESFDLENLWESYKTVNGEIVALYRKLFEDSTNEKQNLKEMIMQLKSERHAISRQMNLAKGMDYYRHF